MAKNKIQHQKGDSLFEFMQDYGTENQYKEALFNWRSPEYAPMVFNAQCVKKTFIVS